MTDSPVELRIGDYLGIIRRRWRSIAVTVVLVTLVAVAFSARTDARYRAEAWVLVRTTAAQDRLDPQSNATNSATLQRRLSNEVRFATSDAVEAAASETYGRSFEVTVRPDEGSDTLFISATAGTAEAAAERANVYATTLVEARTASTADELISATQTLNLRIAEIDEERNDILAEVDGGADPRRFAAQLAALDAEEASLRASLREIQIAEDLALSGAAQVIRAAEPPGTPFEPAWRRNISLALIVGTVVGLGVALLRESLDGTVRSKADLDLASGLPTLALLPPPFTGRPPLRPQVLSSQSGAFVEGIRSLRSSLMFARAQSGASTVFAFSSPSPGEGKTTTAVNLAMSMAHAGHSVVLLDADLRRPRAAEACRVPTDAAGLTEMLLGRTSLVVHSEQVTGGEQFHVVAPGMDVPDPAEMLASDSFANLIDELRAKFEVVIIDTAPILPVADALAVAAASDATVLVARSGHTTRKQVASALELLERADANVIGTVLTDADRTAEYGQYGYGGAGRA